MKYGTKRLMTGGGLTVRVTAGAEGGDCIGLDVDGAAVLLDDAEAQVLSVWLDAARETSPLGWDGEDEDEDGA